MADKQKKKRRNRNSEALTNLEAKRIMLKESTVVIDILCLRLSTLATYALDDRPDLAMQLVAAGYQEMQQLLHDASQTSLTIKRQLHDQTPQPDYSTPFVVVRDWIVSRDALLPSWKRTLYRFGRRCLTVLGYPRRSWRHWRHTVNEKRRREWLQEKQAVSVETEES